MKKIKNKNKIHLIIQITLALAILVTLLLYDLYLHNFHAVIPHQIYRSRELSKTQFNQIIKNHNIKTIINLRGAHPEEKWYEAEIGAVKENHLNHFDFALKSKTLPERDTLKKLISRLATAPRPLLIHCKSGIDRTGLASVIALILNNAPMEKIKEQVSLRYFVMSDKSVGRQLLKRYSQWLQKEGLKTNRQNFYKWLVPYGMINS